MAGHTNFEVLRGKMSAEQRKQADRKYRELRAEMALADIRKMVGMTQQDLADVLGVSQPNVSERENQEGTMEIGTLTQMIEGIGCELEINVVTPDGIVIKLNQFDNQHQAEATADR